MSILTYILLYLVLGTHSEVKQALETHYALKQCPYNWFDPNRAFKRLFWLRSDSGKVVSIPNEYLKVKYIVINLRDSFGAPTSIKNSFRFKQSHYN